MNEQPGSNAAVTSMILGIISVLFWFFGAGALIGVILGVIGLMLAKNAKQEGCTSSIQAAGYILSLIGLIGGAIASFVGLTILLFSCALL